MKVRIHGTSSDGTDDSIILEGSVEEIRVNAMNEVDKRGWSDYWSEVLDD